MVVNRIGMQMMTQYLFVRYEFPIQPHPSSSVAAVLLAGPSSKQLRPPLSERSVTILHLQSPALIN